MKWLGLVALCALFDCGAAIMCYECNSATNPLCWEKVPPPSLQKNCSENDRGVTHTLCRKMVQYVDYGVNGQLPDSRVVRTCGWDESKYKGKCYHRSGFGGRQEVCSCTTDYCNSSSQLLASSALLASVVLAYLQKIVCE